MGTLFAPSDLVEIRGIVSPDYQRNEPGRLVIRRWILAEEVSAMSDVLDRENKNGVNIYFGVNPRAKLYIGTKAGIALCRTVWADLDQVSLPDARKRWEAHSLPEPTIIVGSGHGIHLYWKLCDPADVSSIQKRDAFEGMLKKLYQELGSDSTQDVTRLLRLPGFHNVKQTPVPCSLIQNSPNSAYPLSVFKRWSEQGSRGEAANTIASPTENSLSATRISERHDIQRIRGLLALLDKETDDRSRRDYWVVSRLIELELTSDEIAALVAGKSKFTSESYTKTTINNAFASARR